MRLSYLNMFFADLGLIYPVRNQLVRCGQNLGNYQVAQVIATDRANVDHWDFFYFTTKPSNLSEAYIIGTYSLQDPYEASGAMHGSRWSLSAFFPSNTSAYLPHPAGVWK